MNDDLMFEYLIQMGAMRPEEAEMLRKQKQIDALRQQSMDIPQGQMVGKQYVAPSITQYAANAMQGYVAGKQQQEQDAAMRGMNERQRKLLEDMRKRRQGVGAAPVGSLDPYGNVPTYGSEV